MRWRVARPVVESVKIGDDERRQKQAMKLVNSGCSGEDSMVGIASVDGEGSKDLVKTIVGTERSWHTGLRRLTSVGNLR